MLKKQSFDQKIQKIIFKIAHRFNKTTPQDKYKFDDLAQEGFLGFVNACESYNSDKGQFSSWVWICVDSRLKNYCRKNSGVILEVKDNQITKLTPSRSITFKDELKNLSAEGREIAYIFLEGPTEFLNLVGTEGAWEIRGKLRRYLSNKGWSKAKIKSGYDELKGLVKTF